MKIIFILELWAILVVLSNSSCSTQKTTAAPAQPSEQEIIRYRRTDPNKPPVVLGNVNVIHSIKEIRPVSSAIVSLDKKSPILANKNGEYSVTLSPGTHELVVGQIGYHKSSKILTLATGDSIRLNFHIQYDLRPSTN